MRLLIAGGGTGGHIYPALAVARSLRARAAAPELGWLGGHRGLEGDIVPPAGIPLRLLWLRSLRSAGRDIHLVLDPVRLALSIPQALGLLIARRPPAIFTASGRWRSRHIAMIPTSGPSARMPNASVNTTAIL